MNEKLENKIVIGLTILMLVLTAKVYLDQNKLDCNLCEVTFHNQQVGYEGQTNFTINIKELFEGYANNDCPVYYESSIGFTKRINLTNE